MPKNKQTLVIMKMLLPSWFAAGVLCLIASPASVSAPQADSDAPFKSLDLSIDRVRGLDLPDATDFWLRMLTSSARLEEFSEGPVPGEYAQSLNSLSQALTRVAQDKEVPIKNKVAICEAVAKDLEIKVVFAESERSTPFKNIPFAAKTIDGNNEVSGCEVWYVQTAWEDTERRYLRFPRVSSPTSHELPPGWYSMWTRREGREGQRKPVTVEKDSALQGVDLPAPPSG
jgi:hypothetical protein